MSMSAQQVIHLLTNERRHQDAKWGEEFYGRTDERWLAILMEEVGEVAMAMLKFGLPLDKEDPDSGGHSDKHIEEELVQVMAVVASWLQFRTRRGDQMPYEIASARGYEHLPLHEEE